MSRREIPQLVVVGHVCQDILPDGGRALGGSVSYAATTAQRLGYQVGMVTRAGPDLDVAEALPGVEVVCHPSEATTLFENVYLDDGRRQVLHQRAAPISARHISGPWRRVPLAYLGTIAQELDETVFHAFSDETLLCVMPQGFFRRWDEQGRVHFTGWNPPEALLRRIDLLVLSEQDVLDPERLVRDWTPFVGILVVTRAERGATVYIKDEAHHYPARPAHQVDPTGAGDVFAAAFLVRLFETGDPAQAAVLANAVASFSVEAPGRAGIPRRARVEKYLARPT